jgi:hypothetical protein
MDYASKIMLASFIILATYCNRTKKVDNFVLEIWKQKIPKENIFFEFYIILFHQMAKKRLLVLTFRSLVYVQSPP